MSEWKNCTLGDLGEVVGGGTPSTKKPEYYGGDIAWITPKDLSTFSGRFIKHGKRNITEEGLKGSSARLMPKNTILLSSRAPIGYVAIAENEVSTNQGFKSIVPNDDTDYLFLYYLLKFNKDKIENMGSGTTFKEVSGKTVKAIDVTVPSNKEKQHEIAKILGSLDDKIENNRKINHHLSVIVQAIFNSWFVDYVPFGGTLPSEWKEVDFDEISTVQNGYAFKSKDYVSDGVRMIRTTNFDNGYVNNNDLIMLPSEFYNDAKYRNFVLNKFDTVLVMVGASVGKISLITELNTPSLQNQNMWRFRSIIPEIPESFIHFNVKRINDQVRGWSSGSARDFYRKDIFKKAKVYLPTSQVLDDFSKITMPIFEQISNNILENDKLIKARDSLLPKLMSGEVSVTD